MVWWRGVTQGQHPFGGAEGNGGGGASVLPCRKRAMEAELDACKARLRAVEAQLLEVLEEKLRLKQEVEAWEVG